MAGPAGRGHAHTGPHQRQQWQQHEGHRRLVVPVEDFIDERCLSHGHYNAPLDAVLTLFGKL